MTVYHFTKINLHNINNVRTSPVLYHYDIILKIVELINWKCDCSNINLLQFQSLQQAYFCVPFLEMSILHAVSLVGLDQTTDNEATHTAHWNSNKHLKTDGKLLVLVECIHAILGAGFTCPRGSCYICYDILCTH